jgi:hypothetical protein
VLSRVVRQSSLTQPGENNGERDHGGAGEGAEILAAPVDTLSLSQKVTAHVALKALCEAGAKRIEALKADMTIYVMAKGEKEGEKGTRALTVDDSKVTVEERRASDPEAEGLLALLKTKGIDESEATDTVKVVKVNPSKVAYLLETGKITQDEVDALRAVVPAMRIYPSKALKAAIAPFKALAGKAEK